MKKILLVGDYKDIEEKLMAISLLSFIDVVKDIFEGVGEGEEETNTNKVVPPLTPLPPKEDWNKLASEWKDIMGKVNTACGCSSSSDLYAAQREVEKLEKGSTPPPYTLYHYHLYDKARRPVLSVCLLETLEDNLLLYFRGMALCSPVDYGVLKNQTGKALARQRALISWEAYRRHITSTGLRFVVTEAFQRHDAQRTLKSLNAPSTYKVIGHPQVLTASEKKLIIDRKTKRAAHLSQKEAQIG